MSVQLANILRGIVICEIAFSLGFLAFRLWLRQAPAAYMSLMGLGLACYSVMAALVLVERINQPVSWQLPLAFLAATFTTVAILREGRKVPKEEKL